MTSDGAQTPEGSVAEQAQQAKTVCLRLLAQRPYSRAELAERLARKGFADDVASRVLDRLAGAKLVDDAAFAELLVRSRHTYGGRGRMALANELRRKGVGTQDAEQALAGLSADDERGRAAELVRAKLNGVVVPTDSAERDKLIRRLVGMLARRGYGSGLAFGVVKAELAAVGAGSDGLGELD